MANTGTVKFFTFLLFSMLLLPVNFLSAQEKPEKKTSIENQEQVDLKAKKKFNVHYKMLKKLKLTGTVQEEESFLRRGEIVFFIAFGYTWMYQQLIYEKIMPSAFKEGDSETEVRDRNLFFAVATSAILALFVARNDLQHYRFTKRGRYYTYPKINSPSFQRQKKAYNWYFNFFSWEF